MKNVSEYVELYNESLNEQGYVVVGGMEFLPSRVLEEMDPVAYRCGFTDYLDYMGVDEYDLYWDVSL
jgi:hypothetical protein